MPGEGSCDSEPVAELEPDADETWYAAGFAPATRYTIFAISTDAVGSTCSSPLSVVTDGELPSVERIRFFPSMEFRFRPDPAVGVAVVRFVLKADPPQTDMSEVVVSMDPSGDFLHTVTCGFIGDGTLEVIDDTTGSSADLLDLVPITCDVPEEPKAPPPPFPVVGTDSMPAGLAGTATGGPRISMTGRFVAYEITTREVTSWETVSVNETTGATTTTTRGEDTTKTWSFDGATLCERTVRSRTGGGVPPRTSTRENCSSTPPSRVLDLRQTAANGTRVLVTEAFNPPGRLRGTSTETWTRSTETAIEFSVNFPDVPTGLRVESLRIRQSGERFGAWDPPAAFALAGPGATAAPTWTETRRYAGTCDPVIEGIDWTWSFSPPPTPGATYEFSMETPITCPNSANGRMVLEDGLYRRVTRTLSDSVGNLVVQVHPEADLVGGTALLLQSELERVAPTTDQGSQPSIYGRSDSAVRAALLNVDPGAYTIRIRIDSFDAVGAGHAHGNPPQSLWGELQPGGRLEASCPVVVAEGEAAAFCEVSFQADQIGGKGTVLATVDELPDLEDEVSIVVGLPLANATPILQRPSERVRGGAAAHATADAYFVRSLGPLQTFIKRFEEITTRPQAIGSIPASPHGTYMSFNDMALPLGGRFDIDGNWSGSHFWHRDGEGIDVNTAAGAFDVQTGMSVPIRRSYVERACSVAGGFLVKEATNHCELGTRY